VTAARTATARELNRATLGRQLLLRRKKLPIVDAVHRVVALQAQEPASPYIALWNRIAGFDPVDLDAAFADGSIVKATSLRITLHGVDAADYPAFHEAMQPSLRAARLADPRFGVAGLSIADADALVAEILTFAKRPRTNAEVEAWLDGRLGVLPRPGIWWAVRTYAPFVHAPTGGPWSFGPRPSYIAAPDQRRSGDQHAALQVLIRRYLEGFGPASVQDIAQFAFVRRSRIRTAVEALGDALTVVRGPDGTDLLDVPDGLMPGAESPAPPRLLGMWDNTLLAYADRSRMIPPNVRARVTRQNGDVLPTLLLDGQVAGVWRPVEDGIEATAFRRLDQDEWAGLETEARALRQFLAGRDPKVYGRYGHWWTKGIESVSVRTLART
jgi:hypothetical protein